MRYQELKEYKLHKFDNYLIIENPSSAQVVNLINRSEYKELRVLAIKDTFYIWLSEATTHSTILNYLISDGLNISDNAYYGFYIQYKIINDEELYVISEYAWKTYKNNKYFQQMLKNLPISLPFSKVKFDQKSTLKEYKLFQVPTSYGAPDFKIIENPSPIQFINLLTEHKLIRGVDDGKNIWIWPARYGVHHDVIMFLINKLEPDAISDKHGFVISKLFKNPRHLLFVLSNNDKFDITEEEHLELMQIRGYRNMMKNFPYEFENSSSTMSTIRR